MWAKSLCIHLPQGSFKSSRNGTCNSFLDVRRGEKRLAACCREGGRAHSCSAPQDRLPADHDTSPPIVIFFCSQLRISAGDPSTEDQSHLLGEIDISHLLPGTWQRSRVRVHRSVVSRRSRLIIYSVVDVPGQNGCLAAPGSFEPLELYRIWCVPRSTSCLLRAIRSYTQRLSVLTRAPARALTLRIVW